MTEWIECILSDIGEIVGGATPSTKDDSNYDGDIAWLTPKDLSTFTERYIKKGERSITEKGYKSCSTKILPANSVLFSSRAPIGYVAIAANEMCTNQGFKSIIPNEKVDYMFLYYLLKYKKSAIEGMGSGTTFKEVSGNVMKNIEVRIPKEKSVQKKIAEILDKIDSKIENNNMINRNLSEQLEALYKENIKESDLPARNVTLDELCNIFTGRKNANQNDEDGQYMFFTCGDTPLRINSYIYDGPAIIISGNGSYTGRTLFYNGKFDLYQRTYACTLKEDVIPEYIFGLYAILKIELHKKISGGTHGSSIPYIVMNDLAKFEFDINDESFMEFSKQSKAILDTVMHNNAENEQLVKLRDSLLPKLMSGELDVSDLDI